ncbi:hypothetical protein EV186_111138 [Labedaea rhizosphaerae]|uniref:Uncharacterized protein n=1 Tax=Labedaea rhizosphaerae TaxID=598644 RepID=A0A4R6RT57_LABRH|nr:hypothetical protein EV186_111138 [Labedaea rhizosphaerae]
MAVSAFHQALAEHRERYNAQFRQARLTARQLDAEAMLGHLRTFAGPVVDAATAAGGDPLAVTDAVVDLSYALAGRGKLGAAGRPPAPEVSLGFGWALPALGRFVAEQPRRVTSAVLNALHHLHDADTGHPDLWVQAVLAAAAEVTSVPELLDAGVVVAWRCGLARLRSSALDVAARLDPAVLAIALGANGPLPDDVLDRLRADPWLNPAAAGQPVRLLVVRRVGGFRGFGGAFAAPPTVSHVDGQWYASDGAGCWQLHADRFGAAVTRVATDPGAGSAESAESILWLKDGQVAEGRGTPLDVAELAEPTSWCAAGDTLAATTRFTHSVLFVARTAA